MGCTSGSKARAAPKGRKVYDMILMAVGRSPNGKKLTAEKAGVIVSDRGFIAVDKQMRTNVPHIFAIGDVVGQPMLAHKAVHEAHVAAETAAGKNSVFEARQFPPSLIPIRRSRGPASPRRSAKAKASSMKNRFSPGPRQAAPSPIVATRASQSSFRSIEPPPFRGWHRRHPRG